MRAVVIDEQSINAASAGQLDVDSMIQELRLPGSSPHTKNVVIGNIGYILSRRFQPSDALLVISLLDDGPITSLPPAVREQTLARIFKCTTLCLTNRSRAIPLSWRPFHAGQRISFQADRLLRSATGGRTDSGRVVMEFVRDTTTRIFAARLDQSGDLDLGTLRTDLRLFEDAIHGIRAALAAPENGSTLDSLGNSVALDSAEVSSASETCSLHEWYTARLTSQQLKFVDHPMPGSVRLVGPAGSGKTVALVVKCLRELITRREGGGSPRFLFLTHASSTAQQIESMVLSMMGDAGLELLASQSPSLVITTLQSLANEQMRYELDDLTPVSLDGHEGRVFQADALNSVIEDFVQGDWIAFRAKCSSPFCQYMEASRDTVTRRFFLWELLNEFACVLDSEGVRSGTVRREQYLIERRRTWMLVLQTSAEREVVLRLYDGFREFLRGLRAIGSDQMIADFLSYLDGFRWENTRSKAGFDAVFVDELHLFSRQERLVFRQIMRDPSSLPSVLMAYDAKQSPRDAFLGVPSGEAQNYDLWKDARLGKVDKIELVDIFRYTPQIARALQVFDQSFPGQDLDEEWPAYRGIAKTDAGPIPIVCILESIVDTYSTVFSRASAMQRQLGKKGRVAVLCPSEERFQQLLGYGDLNSLFHLVASRDDASVIPKSTRKFIFSTPEYVAGLQFHTVLLIEVNANEVPSGLYATGALRKFASQVYLGASRAEHRLEIYASQRDGGVATLVSQAVLATAAVLVDKAHLPPA